MLVKDGISVDIVKASVYHSGPGMSRQVRNLSAFQPRGADCERLPAVLPSRPVSLTGMHIWDALPCDDYLSLVPWARLDLESDTARPDPVFLPVWLPRPGPDSTRRIT